VFFTPGEIDAAGYVGYLTNATITGLFAQEIKGAVVLVEREFPNELSQPFLREMQIDTGANRLPTRN
jgi:hypothetical protein